MTIRKGTKLQTNQKQVVLSGNEIATRCSCWEYMGMPKKN